jgi:hypothetical protein
VIPLTETRTSRHSAHVAIISAGEWITASGEWVNDRTHGDVEKRILGISSRGVSPQKPSSRLRANCGCMKSSTTVSGVARKERER